MSKRFTVAYTIFTLIVLAFLIVWFVFRAINTRNANVADAADELDRLSQTVSSAYLTAGSFSESYFLETVGERIRKKDTLQAFLLTTEKNGVEYLYAAEQNYLPDDTNPGDTTA
ncbi:MAG: hypothetical protein HN368_04300, partial [Spirochaetales bacterium]|nr:hypothetical protein [Spirochaetales bacterium]